MNFKETPLTYGESGHSIHNYQVFSPDDQWIVYDVRNHDSLITGKAKRITVRCKNSDKPVGGVVWSDNCKMLACNRYVKSENGSFVQIFLLKNESGLKR